jgi:4-amino-4-deoxy-L-arabinose transferase-like glycosyltransferase
LNATLRRHTDFAARPQAGGVSLPLSAKLLLPLLAFVVLAAAITTRGPKWLNDFDQSFYLTIAYDLNRHGVFSNGRFDAVDSTSVKPPPGMFFGPLYPSLVAGVMKLDRRFAESVNCAVENNEGKRPGSDCEIYVVPMHLVHALLLALGVASIGWAAFLIFSSTRVFWLAGILATAALLTETELFSFLMTESLSFSLYSVAALSILLGVKSGSRVTLLVSGLLTGLLCLARPSFLVLVPFFAVVLLLGRYIHVKPDRISWAARSAAFLAGAALIMTPWLIRNYVSIGKLGLTEEYGSVALVERFAFNDMTPREYALAFPYCVPILGAALVDRLSGNSPMARFQWDAEGSFFKVGRARRLELVAAHGRLDTVMRGIITDEMKEKGFRHLLVSLPLAWCGMWAGGPLALLLVPLFWWALYRAEDGERRLLALYSCGGFVMLALHGLVANHYTRYNLILIGPFAAAGAWMMLSFVRASWPRRAVTS